MTATARRHFDDDIARAESLLGLANGRSTVVMAGSRANDLRLSAVAMAVGAMDAYFCDAYVDCLALSLKRYRRGEAALPDRYSRQLVPAGEVLDSSRLLRPNWSLRMAARAVMERENVLDMTQVKGLLNPVLPTGQKLWPAVMDPLIRRDWKRLTGIARSDYLRLTAARQDAARKDAVKAVRERIGTTVQLRHDWIHNCGRPKVAVIYVTREQAVARLREVRALVEAVDDHLNEHRLV